MTPQQIAAWAAQREWPDHIALEWRMGTPLDRHPLVWAECPGPGSPVCGRTRFSTHGCNGGGPSRAAYLSAGAPRRGPGR